MTVQLEELLKAFELNNPYLKFYLNKNDGHMALVTEIPGDDKAENEVTANPDALSSCRPRPTWICRK